MSDFVVCINNRSTEASLIVGKIYRRLPDSKGEARKMIRVIDEDTSEITGYLYPASKFEPIEISETLRNVLAKAESAMD